MGNLPYIVPLSQWVNLWLTKSTEIDRIYTLAPANGVFKPHGGFGSIEIALGQRDWRGDIRVPP
jgi:hypothetical protein